MKNFFKYFLRPSFWGLNNRYCEEWDLKLNELLDQNYIFTNFGQYSAELGGHLIWTGNYPYASMHPYNLSVSAKRSTIERAMKHYQRDFINSLDKN